MSLDSFDPAARDGFVTGLILGIVVALLLASLIGFSGGPS